jgi:hypothetical protein
MNLHAARPRRSFAEVLLAAEALVLLTAFRVALALLPVRRILQLVTHRRRGVDEIASIAGAQEIATAVRVRWAVLAVTRHAPARFVCFPQSLAAYTMLRCRGVATTIVYGVARSPEGALLAHTWLMVGDRTVVGGEGSGAFTAIERWS